MLPPLQSRLLRSGLLLRQRIEADGSAARLFPTCISCPIGIGSALRWKTKKAHLRGRRRIGQASKAMDVSKRPDHLLNQSQIDSGRQQWRGSICYCAAAAARHQPRVLCQSAAANARGRLAPLNPASLELFVRDVNLQQPSFGIDRDVVAFLD